MTGKPDDEADELIVGVLGGLGPEATVDFFTRVLRHSRARTDQQHLHLLIDNNPKVPDRNAAMRGRGPSPGPTLAAMARRLAHAGADFLVMPCNAAHAWEAAIRAATAAPFVSIIRETCAELRERHPGARRVGVLAVDACRSSGIYDRTLAAAGVETIGLDPPAQRRFMELIGDIKAGRDQAQAGIAMQAFADRLIAAGAEAIIAGCTEVPLVLRPAAISCPLIDSTDVLARRAVAYARRERPLPLAHAIDSATEDS